MVYYSINNIDERGARITYGKGLLTALQLLVLIESHLFLRKTYTAEKRCCYQLELHARTYLIPFIREAVIFVDVTVDLSLRAHGNAQTISYNLKQEKKRI